MKTTNILVSIGIIIIVIIVGMMLSRSTDESEPLPTMEFEEEVSIDEEGETTNVSSEEAAGDQQGSDSTGTSSSQQRSVGTLETVPTSEVTVSMTDTGFEPSTVTIPVGTTVVFVNNGQALHWPASDVHPTHEILPGFDAKRGLATGDTYSYTFQKKGSWGMHDHLNPRSTATVVVE